jgi:hypothetical protein
MAPATKTVTYNMDNIMKCRCTTCPVQTDSSCATDKLQAMSGMMDRMKTLMPGGENISPVPDASSMSGMPEMSAMSGVPGMLDMTLPSAQDMPGLYCATGKAICDDLDYSQSCSCPTCGVWVDNRLDSLKYCGQGSASQIG